MLSRKRAGATDGFPRLGERGASVVEFALVTPFLVLMFTGIIQFGAMFFLQNHMTLVARNTVRNVAVGEMSTKSAKTFAEGKLLNWPGTFTVGITESGADVSVAITIPMEDAAIIDFLGLFKGKTLRASVVMRKET